MAICKCACGCNRKRTYHIKCDACRNRNHKKIAVPTHLNVVPPTPTPCKHIRPVIWMDRRPAMYKLEAITKGSFIGDVQDRDGNSIFKVLPQSSTLEGREAVADLIRAMLEVFNDVLKK